MSRWIKGKNIVWAGLRRHVVVHKDLPETAGTIESKFHTEPKQDGETNDFIFGPMPIHIKDRNIFFSRYTGPFVLKLII